MQDGARCGVCATGLQGPLVTCPACELSYHEDCWAFYRGCALYGCRGPAGEKVVELKPLPPEVPDRRRGTVALLCMVACLALGAGVEKHSGGCCDNRPVDTLCAILFLVSLFFGMTGLVVDTAKARALATFLIPALLVGFR